jgi:DNA (cytosine-5)-methyltransferase 1
LNAIGVAASLTRGTDSKGKGGYAGRRQEDETNLVAHSLRADGFDASEDGTGRGTPLVAATLDANVNDKWGSDQWVKQQQYVIEGKGPSRDGDGAPMLPVAVDVYNHAIDGDVAATLNEASGVPNHSGPKVLSENMAVRRLTPLECERLQGFPDDYTLIPRKNGKPAADGPRYRALGNSKAINCIRWIGRRIEMVEQIKSEAVTS